MSSTSPHGRDSTPVASDGRGSYERRFQPLQVSLWIGVAVAPLLVGVRRVWAFTIDDAGIVYAYARSLAEGSGFKAAVGGPVVAGFSDFLWVLLLVPLHWLGADLQIASKILGVGLGAAGVVLTTRLVDQTRTDRTTHPSWEALTAALILGLCVEFVVWLPSGMENGLFFAALAALLSLDGLEARAPHRVLVSWVPAAAVCLSRPEGILYAAVIGAGEPCHKTSQSSTLG